MKNISCIVCGCEKSLVLRKQSFKDHYLDLINPAYQQEFRSLALCADCGFVFHNPSLDEADMETLYSKFRDASFRNESADEYFDRIVNLPLDQSENFAKVSWIKKHLQKKGGLKHHLDIGCGGGVFLHTLTQQMSEWKYYGIEPTVAFAELAARRLGIPVMASSYRPGLFPDVKFDLITINQVLEHVADPVYFLRSVKSELAPTGHVYLEVPDVEDFAYLAPDHDRFLMQHLWVFSRNSLHNVCRQAGFAIAHSEQLVTVRDKRNLVFLLKADDNADQDSVTLERDDLSWIKSLLKKYSAKHEI